MYTFFAVVPISLKCSITFSLRFPPPQVFPMLDAAGVMYTLVREEKRALIARMTVASVLLSFKAPPFLSAMTPALEREAEEAAPYGPPILDALNRGDEEDEQAKLAAAAAAAPDQMSQEQIHTLLSSVIDGAAASATEAQAEAEAELAREEAAAAAQGEGAAEAAAPPAEGEAPPPEAAAAPPPADAEAAAAEAEAAPAAAAAAEPAPEAAPAPRPKAGLPPVESLQMAPGTEIVDASAVQASSLALGGNCPVTLCHRAGLPFPAEHAAGFVRFRGKASSDGTSRAEPTPSLALAPASSRPGQRAAETRAPLATHSALSVHRCTGSPPRRGRSASPPTQTPTSTAWWRSPTRRVFARIVTLAFTVRLTCAPPRCTLPLRSIFLTIDGVLSLSPVRSCPQCTELVRYLQLVDNFPLLDIRVRTRHADTEGCAPSAHKRRARAAPLASVTADLACRCLGLP